MQYRKTKHGLTVFIANTGVEYREHSKEYVVNMCKNRKMVHRKNCCDKSKILSEFISFACIDEIEKLPFEVSYCQNCFPNQKEYKNNISLMEVENENSKRNDRLLH